MQYLVEQYDTQHVISYPKGTRESYEVGNWLFFLNAGVGPSKLPSAHSRIGSRGTLNWVAERLLTPGLLSARTSQPFPPLCAGEDPVWGEPIPE